MSDDLVFGLSLLIIAYYLIDYLLNYRTVLLYVNIRVAFRWQLAHALP